MNNVPLGWLSLALCPVLRAGEVGKDWGVERRYIVVADSNLNQEDETNNHESRHPFKPGQRRAKHLSEPLVERLRHPHGKRIQSVAVNGKRHRLFDAASEAITIKPGAAPIMLRADY